MRGDLAAHERYGLNAAISGISEPFKNGKNRTIHCARDDRANNRLENLHYVTRQQNVDHAISSGSFDVRGERNPSSKLTWQQVGEIRAKYTPQSYGYKRLAKEFGVSWEAIRNIVKGYVWVEE